MRVNDRGSVVTMTSASASNYKDSEDVLTVVLS